MPEFSNRHLEALEVLAGFRPRQAGSQAATKDDVAALQAMVLGKIFTWEERTTGLLLRINVGGKRFLQACWHTMTASTSADVVWTFPRPFADVRQIVLITPILSAGTNAARNVAQRSPTANDVAFSILNSADARVASQCDLFAWGLAEGSSPDGTLV